MSRLIDLTGTHFGRLRVVERAQYAGSGVAWWCICDCGATHRARSNDLKAGHTKSCGCLRKELLSVFKTTHGHAKKGARSRLFTIWTGMLDRCDNEKSKYYSRYGGRGITVCERWHAFENFLADMGEPPPQHTIERRNNNKGYAPANCKWATYQEQARNRRNTLNLTVGTLTMCAAAWSAELGAPASRVHQRISAGWPVEAACTMPVKALRAKET